MGHMRHHAIVVSASYGSTIDRAHAKAAELGMVVSGIIASPVNKVRSFFVAPDGSKEGWSDSDDGDVRRNVLIGWMSQQRYGDGSGPLSWVEVQYGDDEQETLVVSHSDEESHRQPGMLDALAD